MDLSKARYIFPNLFTLANIAAGFYSIQLAMSAQSVREMTLAAWLIVVAMVCDAFDGRVARATNAQSEFGVQLDSLADAISFGVAPAMLLYNWGLTGLGDLGVFFAFIFAACAVMRLARFNVMAASHGGASKYFHALPTPLAAGAVVSLVMAHAAVTGNMTTFAYWNVAALSILLGSLMVSKVRYRTFKDVNFRGRAKAVLVLLIGLVSAISLAAEPSVAFVVIMALYIVVGLGGGLVELSRNIFGEETELEEEQYQEEYLVEASDEDRG